MERSKALIASAVVAAGLTFGAGVYVAGSGLLAGATDNVGNLQPVVATSAAPTAAPHEITVYVDPVTGAATADAPQVAIDGSSQTDPATAAEVSPDSTGDDHHGDDDHQKNDDHHRDDREHHDDDDD